jgi:hypothetical protein
MVGEQSERAAWKQFQPYLDRVNDVAERVPARSGLTLAEFVKEWRRDVAVNLKGSTTRAAESHLRAHIIPKLGQSASDGGHDKNQAGICRASR